MSDNMEQAFVHAW